MRADFLPLAAALFALGAIRSFAWVATPDEPQWAQGSITFQVQLDGTALTQPLSDGSTTWGHVIDAAVSDWNSHLTISHLATVANSSAPANVNRQTANGYNNVRWGDTIYGDSWDAGGGDVAGITLGWFSNEQMTEADVLFNTSAGMHWDSYRGALKYQSNGQPINDLKRIALHEFGHVLGLDHPDLNGQSVAAVMNSVASNTDALTADDIAGGQHFYGAVVAPTIVTQPIDAQFVVLGGTTADVIVWVHGTPPFTYQWYRGTTLLSGGAFNGPGFSLSNLVQTSYGAYKCVVSNSAGSDTSKLSILAQPGGAPIFTAQPASQTAQLGNSVTFSATAVASPSPTYQWQKGGVNLANGGRISGAATDTLTISNVSSADAGTYTLVAANSGGQATSNSATLTVGAAADPGRIINMSVLTSIGAGEDFTFGYYLGGAGTSGAKPILMRAMGPSLATYGVNPVLPNPYMEFYLGTTLTATNDDWGNDSTLSAVAHAVQAFPFISPSSKDAAIYSANVPQSGQHSIKVFSHDNGSGGVIAELYDATSATAWTTTTPRLINVSVMKNVGSLTTVGFNITGGASVKVLVRAIGPTLGTVFNMTGVMSDPKMALYSQANTNTPIDTNDDWGGGADLKSAFSAAGAFGLADTSKDAALMKTLPAGGYSVQVSAATGPTGTAIIEVYEVP